jgi:hypothetical protein
VKILHLAIAEKEKLRISFDGLWPSQDVEVEFTENAVVIRHGLAVVHRVKLPPKAA